MVKLRGQISIRTREFDNNRASHIDSARLTTGYSHTPLNFPNNFNQSARPNTTLSFHTNRSMSKNCFITKTIINKKPLNIHSLNTSVDRSVNRYQRTESLNVRGRNQSSNNSLLQKDPPK